MKSLMKVIKKFLSAKRNLGQALPSKPIPTLTGKRRRQCEAAKELLENKKIITTDDLKKIFGIS